MHQTRMLLTAVTLSVFLIYFYYITRFNIVFKPSTPYVPNTYDIVQNGKQFQFLVNSIVEWEATLPENYKIEQGKISLGDVCHGQPNGFQLLATGRPLYEYLKKYKLDTDKRHFEPNASTTIQDKRIFYFTCYDSRIQKLEMCPPGHLFTNHTCEPIGMCSGQPNRKRFIDAYDYNFFYECDQGTAVHKRCPPDTVFLHDTCVSTSHSSLYCQFHKEPKILNAKTLLVCRDHQIAYETCPVGFRFFDKPVCEPDACVGLRDGTLIPLPTEQNGPFTFSPGYMECHAGKVDKTETCPRDWDPYLSDDLMHLPMVFDGKQCSVPSFCNNVQTLDPDVLVPVREFTKHVTNWKYSSVLDHLTGYECKGGTRKRVNVEPGYRISKRFKREWACTNEPKIAISERPDKYYDCQTNQEESCPKDHYFDTVACVPHVKNAFSYKGLDFFSFNSLRMDNWMKPWDYSKIPHPPPCTAPESVFMETYNLCSHPDCTKYPFLSMIPFTISLKDGSQCHYEDQKLIKTPSSEKYLYWSQRLVGDDYTKETCVPGKRIQSGNFVWDSTIYTTCDEQEPFVFCPSSSTVGIDSNHACIAPTMISTIPPNSQTGFFRNEVKRIWGIGKVHTIVLINGKDVLIPPDGYEPNDHFMLKTILQGVEIEYQYRVTFPPNVVIPDGVSTIGGAFLMKRKDFTLKSIGFPTYSFKHLAPNFEVEIKYG